MSTIKNRSRLARERAGLSIGQAARRLGMSASTVESIEASDQVYAVADRSKLADVYGVNIEWLDGTREHRDYAAVDGIAGADRLTAHDRDVVAEFAASMQRRKEKP
jgi:transcriptional regulator with XRE-family HTH domain